MPAGSTALQQLPAPEQAIRQLVRIIRPCGTLVSFDNEWDTVSNLSDQ